MLDLWMNKQTEKWTTTVHKWMYRWRDGRMDGLMDCQVYGWLNYCMDAWMATYVDGYMDGWVEK